MTHTCLKRPVLKLSECTWVWGATQRPEKETQRTVLRNWETTPTVLARFARVFLLGQTYTLPAYAHKNWKTPQCKPQNPRGAVSPLDGRRDTALGHFCFFSVRAYCSFVRLFVRTSVHASGAKLGKPLVQTPEPLGVLYSLLVVELTPETQGIESRYGCVVQMRGSATP